MEITENRKIEIIKDVIIKYKCDSCKKEIDTNYLPDTWFKFCSFHHEWGNDSCDSFETYHVCSPKCYFELIEKQIIENKNYESFKINDIPWNKFFYYLLKKLLNI